MHTTFGDIVVELFNDEAPGTVANFLDYVADDFYDGLLFHRVVNDPNPFVIQTGAYDPNLYDPNPDNDPNFFVDPSWRQDPRFYHLPNDPIDNESDNQLRNNRGTLAMALQGTDEDSATSQFFINLVDNNFLDFDDSSPPPFTVFGQVIQGMDVVDAIGALPTVSIGDSFELTEVPDPNNPPIINDIEVVLEFDENSADFSMTDFLRAGDDDIRTYVGQRNFAGQRFLHQFTQVQSNGVKALQLEQTGVAEFNLEAFKLTMARDTENVIRVLRYEVDDDLIVDANSLLDTVPLSDLGAEDMFLKLIAGDVNLDDPNDPDNSITFTVGSSDITQEIIRTDASLPAFPAFADAAGRLVLVKTTVNPGASRTDWTWYDPNQGLLLDLWDNAATEDAIDYTGNGWRFLDPNDLTGLTVNLRAGKSRSAGRDALEIEGQFDMPVSDFVGQTLHIFVGPWNTSIAADAFRKQHDRQIYKFSGSTGSKERIQLTLDFDDQNFHLRARNINLTGLDRSVRLEMTAGSYFGAGQAEFAGNHSFPLALRQGYEDIIGVDFFRLTANDRSGTKTNLRLLVRGEIASEVADPDLATKAIRFKWGTSTATIPANANFGVKRRGNSNKFIYSNNISSIDRAVLDFDRGRFMVVFTNDGYFINNLPRSFTIEFDIDDDTTFSQTVANIGTVSLPAFSQE